MSTGPLAAVNVEHDDRVLDCDCGWTLDLAVIVEVQGGAGAEEGWLKRVFGLQLLFPIGVDDSTQASRVHYVFDADWNSCADYLLHGERMYDLRPKGGDTDVNLGA